MLRRAAAVLAVTLLAGCGSEAPPAVTFAAGGQSVTAAPTQYCEDDFVTCRNDATAPVDLPVPPGTPLLVTVPDVVAATPWQVVFTYRDAAGEQIDERSRVQVGQAEYVLQLPAPEARLITAEVQQYGPPPEIDPVTGDVVYPTRASWVLLAQA